MKFKTILAFILLSSGLFANSMDDAIVLHPRISYRVEADNDLTVEDYHLFGDKVQSNGEIKTFKDSKYVYLEKDGKPYYTYFYFIVQNSIQGVILDESFLYSSDDLSTITENKVDKLTFVAIDKSSLKKDLLKVSYLTKNEKGWLISTGWVKKTNVSTEKDDWGTAIKYFNATQAETKEDRESILGTVFMFNKNSVFIDLIQKMLDEDHLNVNDKEEYDYDPLFIGTDGKATIFFEDIYSEPDLSSEVLQENLEVLPGVSVIAKQRLKEPVLVDGIQKFWYFVEVKYENTIEGWMLR